jgi:hypothetical protein
MKRTIAIFALFIGSIVSAASPPGTKTVRINCGPSQSASAIGTYGAATFGVACRGGPIEQIVPSGTVWSVRIGVETETTAYDCAFSGDSPTVSVDCVGVVLTID